MSNRSVRRQELIEADIDSPLSAGLIDGYYTDFSILEEDRPVLERFLQSADVKVREEALVALIFSTGTSGPKFTGYAVDALILHILGLVADSEAMFTGIAVLSELEARQDTKAAEMLESLGRNETWRRRFREVHVRNG